MSVLPAMVVVLMIVLIKLEVTSAVVTVATFFSQIDMTVKVSMQTLSVGCTLAQVLPCTYPLKFISADNFFNVHFLVQQYHRTFV
jgi:uncharacterized protein YqfA (UPF0365 family)